MVQELREMQPLAYCNVSPVDTPENGGIMMMDCYRMIDSSATNPLLDTKQTYLRSPLKRSKNTRWRNIGNSWAWNREQHEKDTKLSCWNACSSLSINTSRAIMYVYIFLSSCFRPPLLSRRVRGPKGSAYLCLIPS